MIASGTGAQAPRLYIEEWMQTVDGLDRKRLAERMNVSPGTITKKLGKPDAIDGEWLAKFATGLGLSNPLDLYRKPGTDTPRPDAPTQLRSCLLSFGVDRDELEQVIRVISTYVHDVASETEEQTTREDQSQPANPHREPAPKGKRVPQSSS